PAEHAGDSRPHRRAGARPHHRRGHARGAVGDVSDVSALAGGAKSATECMRRFWSAARTPLSQRPRRTPNLETSMFNTATRVSLLCLLLAVALFFWRLGDRDLWSSHEARAAMDASSLLDPDSDGLPRLHDGRLELQKPPLFYWLIAGFAWLG